MTGYTYILLCSDGSYYTGSTNDLDRRIAEHMKGEGANYTRKRLPVKLVYFEAILLYCQLLLDLLTRFMIN